MNQKNNKIIIIAGPTCTGKSDLAVELAKRLDTEIISCDSMQVYKGLDIGTAKINNDEMCNIKHYMIDEFMPTENCDIKIFSEKTKHYIDIIQNNGKIPILVGGTGYYIKSIILNNDFLYEDMDKKNKILENINDELDKYGIEYIYEELNKVDPESTKKIHINNQKRVIRALCFYRLHNKKISDFNEIENKKTSPYDYLAVVLNTNRELLYDRINDRVDKMIDTGLIQEVASLIDSGVTKDSNAMQAIGYKELYDYCFQNMAKIQQNLIDLKNDPTLLSLIEKIKQNSRNYAKRQLTWFNAQKNFYQINIEKFSFKKNLIADEIFTKNEKFFNKKN